MYSFPLLKICLTWQWCDDPTYSCHLFNFPFQALPVRCSSLYGPCYANVLCYAALCHAKHSLLRVHDIQTNMSHSSLRNKVQSRIFTSRAFLLRYSTCPSNSTRLKSTASFFPQTQFLSHIFSIFLYITPKVILDPFLSFSLFFIQSPNLMLSKYLFHLSFFKWSDCCTTSPS